MNPSRRVTTYALGFVALILFAALLSGGCSPVGTSWPYETNGPTLTEPAIVVDVAYTPGNHGTGSGVGMSTNGDLVMTSTSVDLPPKWATVFQCQHGRFIIDGKETYDSVMAGDSVTVVYREVFIERRHITESGTDGVYDTTYTRALKDYDFLKAVPKR